MACFGEEGGLIRVSDMNPDDLIRIAESLASGRAGNLLGRPRQAELRRAVSTAYYALFHTLANHCADLLVGTKSSDRSDQAWRQTYRSIEHGEVKRRYTDRRTRRVLQQFPTEIQDFVGQFVRMQELRHWADYDPFEYHPRSSVLQLIEETKTSIAQFNEVDRKDRRAFAVFVLFRLRGN